MLVLKQNVKIKDLEKYGFKILQSDEQVNKWYDKCNPKFYCDMAVKRVSGAFDLVVCNDDYYRELVIQPAGSFQVRICVSHQLDEIYNLIKAGLVEKWED